MIRLYFNKKCPKPWSVDSGPGTPESNFDRVLIETAGHTVFNAKAGDNENTPTAWVEFTYGTLIDRNGVAFMLE